MTMELSTIEPGEVELYDSRLPADLSELSREQLAEWGRAAVRAGEMTQWMLGDLACEVETKYGESNLQKYAEEIGVNYSTLRSYKTTSAAFPADSVGRRTHSYGVYDALAALEDRFALVSAEHMTVQQARCLKMDRDAAAGEARYKQAEAKSRKEAEARKKAAKGTRRRTVTPSPDPVPPAPQPPQPREGLHLVGPGDDGLEDEPETPDEAAESTIKIFMSWTDLRNVLWALYLEHPAIVRNAITSATLFEPAALGAAEEMLD